MDPADKSVSPELDARARRFELALEGSGLAVWDWDVPRDRVYLGAAWSEMLGEAGGETTTSSASLIELVHPDDVEAVRSALAFAMRGGERYEIEHRVRTVGGAYRWIVSRGKVFERDAAGRVLRMTGTNRDITARKRAEDALAARELQLRLLADNVPLMIVELDASERYRYCNRSYAQFFGSSPDTILGCSVREIIGEEAYPVFAAGVERARKGETVTYEREVQRPEGGAAVLEMRIVPQMRRHAEYSGCYVLGSDITARKRLERAKDDFVSMVGHELRTPLKAIRAVLAALQRGEAGELTAEARRQVEVAHGNCERLVRLVSDLLDFQRARSGRVQLALGAHAPHALARRALEANEAFARERAVLLQLTAADLAGVQADADRVIQALTNLIGNAIRHSEPGARVELSLEQRRGAVRFWVHDRGPGVPENFRAHLFRQFSQAEPSTVSVRHGSGLGLSITKALIEQMGGGVGYQPRPGGGASFWIELPLAE